MGMFKKNVFQNWIALGLIILSIAVLSKYMKDDNHSYLQASSLLALTGFVFGLMGRSKSINKKLEDNGSIVTLMTGSAGVLIGIITPIYRYMKDPEIDNQNGIIMSGVIIINVATLLALFMDQ